MSFRVPSPTEIFQRMRTDSQAVVPELNSGLRESLHVSMLKAFAAMSSEQFRQMELLLNNMFIDTASQEYLEIYGTYKKITRNPAAQARGFITVSGVNLTSIPQGTSFSSSEGISYLTLANETITSQNISIVSITRVGNLATVTTSSDHLLSSGISVSVSGADQTEYNGTFIITVTDVDKFTYIVSGSPITPATGTISSSYTTASIEVQATTTGLNGNQLSGVSLTVDSPISGLDNTAYVQFGELGGGINIESDDDLRIRILESYQNPIALFNVAQIKAQAKLVSGVGRVFVQQITPAIGQVTIYFTRDKDDNIIPSLSEVSAVKDKILEIKPAHVADSDVIVSAPTPVPTNFTFSSIVPNTQTMKDAISQNLNLFFRERTIVGQTVLKIEYECAIQQTIDTATGEKLQSFSLISPAGDIVITIGQIATLGSVIF